MTPAATWPASLLIGLMPHRSSITPMATITPPASSRPVSVLIVEFPLNTPFSGFIWPATRRPAASPAYMATPPNSGIGMTCTSRSRTCLTAPALIATRRTSGVSM